MSRSALPLILAAICLLSVQATAATRVEIVIDEPHADRSVVWPVTTGVPFPRGGLTAAKHCRLVDDRGTQQPLQAKVAATWDKDKTSIRWLTIDFLAEPNRKYFLEFGPNVERKAFATPLTIKPGKPLRVETGTLVAEFSQTGASSLKRFLVDTNGDGKIEDDEVIATGADDGEHYYTDQDGQRFSSAGDGKDRHIVVETTGPVRACVRVDGFYTGPKGQRIVKYRTRYHFFAGLGLVKVIDEFHIAGSTQGIRFNEIGFALQLTGSTDKRTVAVDASGEPGNQVALQPWQPETESISSFQSTYRHFGNTGCDGAFVEVTAQAERRLRQNLRIGEWMQVSDPRATVTGSLRRLWQQFPKAWEVTPDRLKLHLWSPRGGELDFSETGIREVFGNAGKKYLLDWGGVPRQLSVLSNFFYFAGRAALARGEADGKGINKHHEFYLHFAPAAQSKAARQYGNLAGEQPLALASGKWNCSTDVFGPLAARPNNSKYEQIVDRLFDLGRYAQDTFGDYGWWIYGSGPHYSYQWDPQAKRHYADPRRFEYHTYQKETQLWWCYLRSGERKFYDWAFPSEDHWIDIAVAHEPTTYSCDWKGGDPLKQTNLHWRPGEWAVDSPLFHVRQRDSAEAWLRAGSQFWGSYHRTLETTTLAYYLTGDERYNDVINYWRDYWVDLAGKNSASKDLPTWHHQQAWFVPTKPGQPTKTWAEMIRDYAPFTSGSRHQQTLFFNLATLYEHTWDPQVGQVAREYADAFLDADSPVGVWLSHENRLPAHAPAPKLAHFWTPALWKYARATGEERMKKILPNYLDACYGADPFREDVGVYSNVQIGYAYYITRDPKHLRPAQLELERLWPNALPLEKQQDLNRRLYNPYAPIHSFTATPRLIWALNEAKQNGALIPPPAPLRPQRTPIALHKQQGRALQATLWGYDQQLTLIGPDGKPFDDFKQTRKQYASEIQPFDRVMPGFAVFEHRLTIAADAPAGFYILSPSLELAVLGVKPKTTVLANAARPVAVESGQSFYLRLPRGVEQLQLQSAAPHSVPIYDAQATMLPKKGKAGTLTYSFDDAAQDRILRIENIARQKVYFRIVDWPAEQCWIAASAADLQNVPSHMQSEAALQPMLSINPDDLYVSGRFGRGVLLTENRPLKIPDHIIVDGKTVRLTDAKQGTIEFWVRRLWDDRLTATRRFAYLTNGEQVVPRPPNLPLNEWSHVAVVWRPFKRDPNKTVVHVYVDGRDRGNYRNVWWKGYGSQPYRFPANGKWLKEFISQPPPGAAWAIDELRVSTTARYANFDVIFGGQQTYNPLQFSPTAKPFAADANTTLLFHFDGDLTDAAKKTPVAVEGRLTNDP